jgi:hypothetical protein
MLQTLEYYYHGTSLQQLSERKRKLGIEKSDSIISYFERKSRLPMPSPSKAMRAIRGQ